MWAVPHELHTIRFSNYSYSPRHPTYRPSRSGDVRTELGSTALEFGQTKAPAPSARCPYTCYTVLYSTARSYMVLYLYLGGNCIPPHYPCRQTVKRFVCVPRHTVLHCTVLDDIALQCLLYSNVLHCTALHCTALHCTVQGAVGDICMPPPPFARPMTSHFVPTSPHLAGPIIGHYVRRNPLLVRQRYFVGNLTSDRQGGGLKRPPHKKPYQLAGFPALLIQGGTPISIGHQGVCVCVPAMCMMMTVMTCSILQILSPRTAVYKLEDWSWRIPIYRWLGLRILALNWVPLKVRSCTA